jgi:hypothetical protein
MAKHRTSALQQKLKASKSSRKRPSRVNIAQRYFELRRMREILKAEADAR